ncbi:MAG: thioredoxin domain-containing protein [Alphaproteobacteria bacterium]
MHPVIYALLISSMVFLNFKAKAEPEISLEAGQLLNQDPPFPFQHLLGNEEAKACTVVVYTSLSCDACATFHKKVGSLLEKYPKVRVISRDYPTDGPSLMASLLCWCQPEKSELLRKAFYEKQKEWVNLQDPREFLKQIAQDEGLPKGVLETCLDDKAFLKRLMEFKLREKNLTKLESVPLAFVIGYPKDLTQKPSVERIEHADLEKVEAVVAKYFP